MNDTELHTLEQDTSTEGQAKIDAMLNKQGFVEFLAEHKEEVVPDENGAELMEKRFEVFMAREVVKEEIKKIFADRLSTETGFVLGPEQLKHLDIDFNKKALENPEEILELKNKIIQFKELPIQIKALEEQLGSLGTSEDWNRTLEELKKTKENIVLVKEATSSLDGISGLLDVNIAKRIWSAFLSNKKEGIGLHPGDLRSNEVSIDEKIATVENVLKGIQVADEFKKIAEEHFGALRKEILKGVGANAEIAKIMQAKVYEQMKAITGSKDFDKAQLRFEELQKIIETGETGVDLLGEADPEKIQKSLDNIIETSIFNKIKGALTNFKLGQGNLFNLEKILDVFLKKDKVGSKEGEEAKKIISRTLDDATRNLADTTENKAKKILIARIKIKYKL